VTPYGNPRDASALADHRDPYSLGVAFDDYVVGTAPGQLAPPEWGAPHDEPDYTRAARLILARARTRRLAPTLMKLTSASSDPTARSFRAGGRNYTVLGDVRLPLFASIRDRFGRALPQSKYVRLDDVVGHGDFRTARAETVEQRLSALEQAVAEHVADQHGGGRVAALEDAFNRHVAEEDARIDALEHRPSGAPVEIVGAKWSAKVPILIKNPSRVEVYQSSDAQPSQVFAQGVREVLVDLGAGYEMLSPAVRPFRRFHNVAMTIVCADRTVVNLPPIGVTFNNVLDVLVYGGHEVKSQILGGGQPIVLPFREFQSGAIECWQDGPEIACTIKFLAPDGSPRMATSATDFERHAEEVVGCAAEVALGVEEVLAVGPFCAQVLGCAEIVGEVCGLAHALLKHRGGDPHVAVAQPCADADVCALVALLQRCQRGDRQACAEAEALGRMNSALVEEALACLERGQREKARVRT
jgi:hypothetical protein